MRGVYFEKDKYGLIMQMRFGLVMYKIQLATLGEGVVFEKDRYGLIMYMRWGYVMYK